MARPFGTALMFAGCDQNGPQLYHMDPAGTFGSFQVKAMGAAGEQANTRLYELFKDGAKDVGFFFRLTNHPRTSPWRRPPSARWRCSRT